MLRRRCWFLLGGVVCVILFLQVSPCRASCGGQCCSCHDYATCYDWSDSPLLCGEPWNCQCAASPKTAYAVPLQPGFLTNQVGGQLLVSAVVMGSPADAAGVAPGDEIVEVDGKRPGAPECGRRTRSSMTLKLRKAGKEREVAVGLLPVDNLLASRWQGTFTIATPVPDQLFSYGFRGSFDEDRSLVVSATLVGSPADAADIRPGDKIIAVAGSPDELLPQLMSPEPAQFADLLVVRGAAKRNVRLKASGLYQILRTTAAPPAIGTELAVAAPVRPLRSED